MPGNLFRCKYHLIGDCFEFQLSVRSCFQSREASESLCYFSYDFPTIFSIISSISAKCIFSFISSNFLAQMRLNLNSLRVVELSQ